MSSRRRTTSSPSVGRTFRATGAAFSGVGLRGTDAHPSIALTVLS